MSTRTVGLAWIVVLVGCGNPSVETPQSVVASPISCRSAERIEKIAKPNYPCVPIQGHEPNGRGMGWKYLGDYAHVCTEGIPFSQSPDNMSLVVMAAPESTWVVLAKFQSAVGFIGRSKSNFIVCGPVKRDGITRIDPVEWSDWAVADRPYQ